MARPPRPVPRRPRRPIAGDPLAGEARAWEAERKSRRKADAQKAREWEKQHPEPQLIERHDEAVGRLADYLAATDLYVVFPKRMTSREEGQVERRNDEFFALYLKLREEKMGKTKAVETAAEMCGYGATRAWEIIKLREGKSA